MTIVKLPLNPVLEDICLTAYLLTSKPKNHPADALRPAVIVCPGGAFISLDEDAAEPVIVDYLSRGFQVFLLSYSTGAPYARFPAPFMDLVSAVQYIEKNAHGLGVHLDKIVLCGIGTGAFLPLWLKSHPDFLKSDKLHFEYDFIRPIENFQHLKDLLMSQGRDDEAIHHLEMVYRATLGTATPTDEQLNTWSHHLISDSSIGLESK